MIEALCLDIAVMDDRHDAFLTLLDEVKRADTSDFIGRFSALIDHTTEHFAFEESMMQAHDFYAKQEHIDEHRHLLSEMEYFYKKAKQAPQFGRAYIDEYAYDKFKRHIINIDAQLAMFFKTEGIIIPVERDT